MHIFVTITNLFYMRKKYFTPAVWVEQTELEEYILITSGEGEDLTSGEFDPWVGGEY